MPQTSAQVARKLDALHERLRCLDGNLHELVQRIEACTRTGKPSPKHLLERYDRLVAAYQAAKEDQQRWIPQLPGWVPQQVSKEGEF